MEPTLSSDSVSYRWEMAHQLQQQKRLVANCVVQLETMNLLHCWLLGGCRDSIILGLPVWQAATGSLPFSQARAPAQATPGVVPIGPISGLFRPERLEITLVGAQQAALDLSVVILLLDRSAKAEAQASFTCSGSTGWAGSSKFLACSAAIAALIVS